MDVDEDYEDSEHKENAKSPAPKGKGRATKSTPSAPKASTSRATASTSRPRAAKSNKVLADDSQEEEDATSDQGHGGDGDDDYGAPKSKASRASTPLVIPDTDEDSGDDFLTPKRGIGRAKGKGRAAR